MSGPRIQRERIEAQAVIKLTAGRWWARVLHHSPNEELSITGRQLAASQGTRKGFPDYILPLRKEDYVGLVIELKASRPHKRQATPKQKAWLEHFTLNGWLAKVCHGADDALETLNDYIALGATRPKS